MWGAPVDPIDLIYISGLKMNVSNLGTAGHQFFDVRHVLIENSHYGWSHNTGAAIDLYRTTHAILDQLTCVAEADRIRVDARTERVTVINSLYREVDSQAQTTSEMQTEPEDDPVQYVRQQFFNAGTTTRAHCSLLLVRSADQVWKRSGLSESTARRIEQLSRKQSAGRLFNLRHCRG